MEKLIEIIKNKDRNSINDYLVEIMEKISGFNDLVLKKDDKHYLLFFQDKLLCKIKINRFEPCYDYILNVFEDNVIYSYFIDDVGDKLILNLRDYYYSQEDVSYHIIDLGYGCCVRLIGKEKGIEVKLEGTNFSKDELFGKFKKVDFNTSIEELYQKILPLLNDNNLKIRKYNISSLRDTKEEDTDVLVIKNNSLIEFMNTKIVNGKKYVIKKVDENYSITCYNANADILNNSYLVFEESIDFAKKLEKK